MARCSPLWRPRRSVGYAGRHPVEISVVAASRVGSKARRATLIGLAAMVAACSGGQAAPTAFSPPGGSPGGNPGASNPAGQPGVTPTEPVFAFSFPPYVGPTNMPSTARAQVVNAYVPGTAAPFAIDVFAGYPTAGAKPLLTVPFGQVSPAFDPTVGSAQGDMTLTFSKQGSIAQADQIIAQSETVAGGERYTMFVNTSATGFGGPRNPGQIQTFFDVGGGDTGNPSPEPGQAALLVDSLGLDAIWGEIADQNYIKVGDACLPFFGQPPGSQVQPAAIGSESYFSVTPGTAPIVAYTAPLSQSAQCSGSPTSDPVTGTFAAGEIDYLFLYATDKTSLKSLFVAQLH